VSLNTLISLRTAFVLSLACLPLTIGASPAQQADTSNQVQKTNVQAEQLDVTQEKSLFVQSVASAKIERDKSGIYSLTLLNISPFVTQFSERPHRKTALISIERLVNLWLNMEKDGFGVNPPNADIACEVKGLEGPQNYAVVLTEPVYSVEKKTLVYQIKPLEGSPAFPDSAELSHVSLFIDDVCLDCWDPS
jgi:hypothetical protein